MEEKENIEVQITDLKNAYNDIVSALNNLSDIDGLDAEYEQLDRIAEAIEDRRTELESDLETLEEEQYIEENAEEWQTEQKELEREYWASQF